MLLGSAGVGKTCFTRSLMKKKFQNDTNSTIVSELHSVVPVNRQPRTAHTVPARPVQYRAHMFNEKMKWKEVDENDEIEEVARLISAVYEKSSGSEDLRTAVAALSLYKVDSSLSLSELSVRKIRRKEVDSFLEKAIKRAQKIGPVPIQDIKPQPFMHIWDCGGQAVFLEILPAFLTPRTLFFLI